jgi:UrcA family protein
VKTVNGSRLVALLAGTVVALGSTAASATQNAMIATHVRVIYRDLDLNQPADAVKLYARLRQASSRACGGYTQRDSVCYKTALETAVREVRSPLLTAVHLQAAWSSQIAHW